MNRLEANRWPVLLVVLILYWLIGFYPYQVTPYHNGVVLTADQVLRFDTPGIVFSREPPAWLPVAIASSSMRMTLEIRSTRTGNRRWARILSLAGKSNLTNLSIAQDGSDMVVRIRTPDTDLSGRPSYVINEFFAQPGWRRIELNILPRLLTVTTDGREVLREILLSEPLTNWSPEYRLVLGNKLGFNRPWLGELRKVVVQVAGQDYDYTLPDALEAPASYPLPLANRYIQWLPFSNDMDGRSVTVDNAVNLFGFIPFGMILAMILHPPRSLFALAAMCCAMSLSIEAVQLFLAPRTPSIDDLLLNTLGGTLGAWLGLKVRLQSGHG